MDQNQWKGALLDAADVITAIETRLPEPILAAEPNVEPVARSIDRFRANPKSAFRQGGSIRPERRAACFLESCFVLPRFIFTAAGKNAWELDYGEKTRLRSPLAE
jgi:hypothetical protein